MQKKNKHPTIGKNVTEPLLLNVQSDLVRFHEDYKLQPGWWIYKLCENLNKSREYRSN